jgi:hypothetical protein
MNVEAKKLWERIIKKREELGAADFTVAQAELARAHTRQDLGGLMVRFNEVVTEQAKEEGIDPAKTPYSVDRFEFEVPSVDLPV